MNIQINIVNFKDVRSLVGQFIILIMLLLLKISFKCIFQSCLQRGHILGWVTLPTGFNFGEKPTFIPMELQTVTRASLMAQTVKNLPEMQETQVWSLGWEEPLEEGMATHSSILAWRIPWTEDPAGLQSTGWQRVRHDLTKQQHYITLQIYVGGRKAGLTQETARPLGGIRFLIRFQGRRLLPDTPRGTRGHVPGMGHLPPFTCN